MFCEMFFCFVEKLENVCYIMWSALHQMRQYKTIKFYKTIRNELKSISQTNDISTENECV